MQKHTRRNVSQGLRRGIIVRERGAGDLVVFHALSAAASRRRGIRSHRLENVQTIWEQFAPHGYVAVFLAEHAGEERNWRRDGREAVETIRVPDVCGCAVSLG